MKNETIKNGLKVLLVAVIFSSCEPANVPIKTTEFIVIEGYEPIKTIEIDSCEYLLGMWDYAAVLIHKGNCKYCTVRAKNNCH